MDRSSEDSTDGSSIKPVSSLRSHFENMLGSNTKSPAAPPPPRHPTPRTPDRLRMPEDSRRTDGRISLDIPRDNGGHPANANMLEVGGNGSVTPRGRPGLRSPWSSPKPRPSSMMSYPQRSKTRSPPKLLVQSPQSSPKATDTPVLSPRPSRASNHPFMDSPPSTSPTRSTRPYKTPSRQGTPSESTSTPSLHSTAPVSTPGDPHKFATYPSASHAPPPVNRAGKPKIPGGNKPQPVETAGRTSLNVEPTNDGDERVSPFSTPPSSAGSARGEFSPPGTDPSPPKNSGARDSYFPPPKLRTLTAKIPALDTRISPQPPKRSNPPTPAIPTGDTPEERPGLPPRRDDTNLRKSMVLNRPAPPEPPVRRSMDMVRPDTNGRARPPPKRTQTMAEPETSRTRSLFPPKPPPPRNSAEMIRPTPSQLNAHASKGYDSDDVDPQLDQSTPALTDYPDPSGANRRPPLFHIKDGAREIHTKYDTKLFAICGEYICTTGYITKVWSLITGELLMSLSHGDTVKATAVAFRPAKDVEDEGKRLWIGTNIGEMHEIDIPSQSVVYTKSNAHIRTAIIKIYRYASEMWSLDEEGRIHIWPPDEHGSPTLSQTPNSFRVARGHSFSIISGSQLWIAFGKEIRVYQRINENPFFQQVTLSALSQPTAGDVTSGAILSGQPDRIYFGHIDGKVSIYARKGFACLGVVNVSLYKISSLVGVGDYLWAGYITGMIYVYDTRSSPWKVKKDWRAHESKSAIAGILADRTSIWKLDRLQVASLGTADQTLRIWDGMLRDDWLEAQMQAHDTEYCSFREITATVMTWNAGASKPTALRHEDQDRNFYRELLGRGEPPDLLVFGFQELVDLEDKKVTAKSFFKKHMKKSKDRGGGAGVGGVAADDTKTQHMSHQYRAWRDHLERILHEYLPGERYTLLHTADMIGLFTCIFVKQAERSRIRDVSAAQVKLGMGGLHGNKGALIVRFFCDDSSLCFINCHLAAGQTQTVHRNNDVAAIMEAAPLPRNRSPSDCTSLFVGGGDGSMILDHEICVLNGDLNYRIDSMTREGVVRAVRDGDLEKLLERDQLLRCRRRNPGFRLRAFEEGRITFEPTYKYDVGTDEYDTSEKRRSPAWCDRVLFRGQGRVRLVEYRRFEGVRVSDHRPVAGRFQIRVKRIDEGRRERARERWEGGFREVERRVAGEVKHDYLCNVFGLSAKEAERLLKGGQ